jgi:hypothetical protein
MALASTYTLKSNGRKINTTSVFLTIPLCQHYRTLSKTGLFETTNSHLCSMTVGSYGLWRKSLTIVQGGPYLRRQVHGDRCTAGYEAHRNFADETIYLLANTIRNEVVTIHRSQEALKMLSVYTWISFSIKRSVKKQDQRKIVLNTGHEYGIIEKTVTILHIEKKGQILDTCERFHIHEIGKQNLQLNDNFTETFNPIYNTIIFTYLAKHN